MIKAIAQYCSSIPPVFTDGVLYVMIALFGFLETQFGSDEAAKFFAPVTLWWIKLVVGSGSVSAVALKLFRSTSFADHQAKKANGDTQTWKKQEAAMPETKVI
jgi:hypothetical protein